ncbi:MAG: transcriptional repressor LexA [Clostridia bacterium]|nr:transcriptional repressor LexA [Clostridia bacterium]
MAANIDKQQQILSFIELHTKEKGYPPTVREICSAVGLNSPSTVHGYLSRLEKSGKIIRDASSSRGIRLAEKSNVAQIAEVDKATVLEVPVIGSISAGRPILAEENVERTFPLPLDFARGSDVFMLKIRGDSMINAGILDGDFVIIKSQPTASNGEIVAALIDDSATVKTFYKENGHFRLQPENDALSPIIVDSVSIIGKVIGVYRIL